MVERKVSIESCSLVNQTIVDEIHKINEKIDYNIEWKQKWKRAGDKEGQDFHQQAIDEYKEKITEYEKALDELKNCGCLMTLKP